jgi:hypothetical protein
MAQKKPQLLIELSQQFEVRVPGDAMHTFQNDLKRGEICLGYEMVVGDEITMGTIYPDEISNGEMKILDKENGLVSVSLSGSVLKELDPKFDQDLIAALKKDSQVVVQTQGLSDSDGTSLYVDGDEDKTLVVGKASLS